MNGCLKYSQKVHVSKLRIGISRKVPEYTENNARGPEDRINKSVYFILTVCNNGQFKNRWTICICIGSKIIASALVFCFFSAISALIFFLDKWRRIVEKAERREKLS